VGRFCSREGAKARSEKRICSRRGAEAQRRGEKGFLRGIAPSHDQSSFARWRALLGGDGQLAQSISLRLCANHFLLVRQSVAAFDIAHAKAQRREEGRSRGDAEEIGFAPSRLRENNLSVAASSGSAG
jgi:hypothetical protein